MAEVGKIVVNRAAFVSCRRSRPATLFLATTRVILLVRLLHGNAPVENYRPANRAAGKFVPQVPEAGVAALGGKRMLERLRASRNNLAPTNWRIG